MEDALTRAILPSSPLDDLSDDIFTEILFYNDFSSAHSFCHCVSGSIRRRVETSSPKSTLHHFWKLMFDRQLFAPIENHFLADPSDHVDYVAELKSRRRLLYNLLQVRSKRRRHNRPCCFSLPNRCFYFKPILPVDIDTEEEDEHSHQYVLDPPPVNYECDSFVLTSCGTSPELLLLDPFDGRLSVISDIIYHCVASDEAVMELAMFQAANAIVKNPLSAVFTDWMENEIAGHCFEGSAVRNHLRRRQQQDKSTSSLFKYQQQELLTQDDVLLLDLSSYFHRDDDTNQPVFGENAEFDLICQGVDSKPILEQNGKHLAGYMIGLGRTVTSANNISAGCTELSLWVRSVDENTYNERLVCRYPWSVGNLDYDPTHRRVFANNSSGPLGPDAQTVVVYPMLPWVGDQGDYFPTPLGSFQACHRVVLIVVDSLGDKLMLGTNAGTIEIWGVAADSNYQRITELKVVACLSKAIDEWINNRVQVLRIKSNESKIGIASDAYSSSSTLHHHQPSDGETLSPISSSPIFSNGDDISATTGDAAAPWTEEEVISFRVLKRQPDLPVFKTDVDFIFLPKHLSIEQAGFVTLQHHAVEGSSLLLWRNRNGGELKVVAFVNLRISSRQKPRIHFDGNRLIVFGVDHIGVIILVYHVATGDNPVYRDSDDSITGEHSGGVYNLTDPPQLRFANRIRHAALGGIDRLDTIHMTVNERFIIVNTKSGNLLGEDASSFSEGLLVIDLEDQGHVL